MSWLCPKVRKEFPSLLFLLNLGSIPNIAFSRYQADWRSLASFWQEVPVESLKLSVQKLKLKLLMLRVCSPLLDSHHHTLETNKPHFLGKTRRKRKKKWIWAKISLKLGVSSHSKKRKTLENKETWYIQAPHCGFQNLSQCGFRLEIASVCLSNTFSHDPSHIFLYKSWTLFFLLFFGGGGHHAACGILVPQPGIKLEPLLWKHRVLITGSTGKSQSFLIFQICYCIFVVDFWVLLPAFHVAWINLPFQSLRILHIASKPI